MRIYNRGFRAEDAGGRPIAGAHVTLWDAQAGGTQITTGIEDLTGAAIAGGVLVCDTWGYPPGFQDTMDRPDIWAIGSDSGVITGVERVHLEPDDTDDRLTAFEASVGTAGGPAGPLDGSGLIPSAQVPGGGGGGGPSLSGTVTAETAYGASSSAGSAATASRGDHTHGTPALTSSMPGSSAVGDTAAVGTATAPARADHVHGREAFGSATAQTSYGASSANGAATTTARSDHAHGTVALTSSTPGNSGLGDTAAVGTGTAPARADHTHGREAAGTPGASAVADTAASGSATTVARSDHRHSREAFGSVSAQTSYGASSSNGTATTPSRSDHTHGTPANPLDTLSLLRIAMTPSGRTETRSRLDSGTNGVITSGTLYLVPIYLTAGQVVSSITFVAGSTALAASTNKWFGLYDSSRNLLAATADDTSNAWALNTAKTLNIANIASGPASSFTATYSGLHYLSLSVSATTVPTITSGTTANGPIATASPAWGASPTSQVTPPAFPFQPSAPTSAGPSAYAWTA